jgi:hypothetical protein
MTPNDETRERFLAAVAERLTPDTIAEAHVFPPIRQGGIESGVAVIAVSHSSVAGGEDAAEYASPRLTVYTAKYRLTLKGPDRGKWEFALQAEADAPLLTVDKVVRGVQQRSGDAEDPLRLSGDEFRALLPLTP